MARSSPEVPFAEHLEFVALYFGLQSRVSRVPRFFLAHSRGSTPSTGARNALLGSDLYDWDSLNINCSLAILPYRVYCTYRVHHA